MIKYAAFLRGINVGGHNAVRMDALRKAFEASGFSNVKTLLASGNVIFETSKTSESTLALEIAKMLENTFGREVGVLIRSVESLQKLADQDLFVGIKITPQTRLYVTFLSEKSTGNLKIPYESSEGNFKIIRATASEVYSVLTITPNSRSVDLMSVLEKEFGRKITTRNWNTIEKILKASKVN